jgi:hypothetical protein
MATKKKQTTDNDFDKVQWTIETTEWNIEPIEWTIETTECDNTKLNKSINRKKK